MSTPQILIYKNADELAKAAAERFAELARDAIAERGLFRVALSGGNTPNRVYSLLASDEFKTRIEWSKVHLFFGDERCVPPDDSESNYRMVLETLISHVEIPRENVHRIRGEEEPLQSAKLYEAELKEFFAAAGWPRFDLVLLGMGDDGHTASLFPQTAALDERNSWVVANWVEKLGVYRISLTVPVINAAANIAFLVIGSDKAERLAEVIHGPFDKKRLPSQLIKPTDGTLLWLVDTAAAALLDTK